MTPTKNEISKKISLVKENFTKQKKKIELDFYKTKKGTKNCKKISEITDKLIEGIFTLTPETREIKSNLLILAVGGYGRKQLAPYSDIDLLFAHNQVLKREKLKRIIEFILYPLWDLGLKVGYSVRNFKEIISFSKKDHTIKTTILDARVIVGSKNRFKEVISNYKVAFSKNTQKFLKEKILERKKKIKNLGFDYFRNEPNLKDSDGSLRDINLIFWALKILNISKNSKSLNYRKFLTTYEKRKIYKALDYILTLRCFTHYISKRQNDKLTFDLQKLIAAKIIVNSEKIGANKATERLMKSYFAKIKEVKNLTQIIIDSITLKIEKKNYIQKFVLKESFKKGLFRRIFEDNFSVADSRIVLNNLKKIKKKDLFLEENQKYFRKIFFSNYTKQFLKISDVGLLGKMIPAFSKIDNLPQFDRFHALSVGQHTLKAFCTLKTLGKDRSGKIYKLAKKIIKNKFNKIPLFYAVLLHDIGKGLGGDHSSKGAFIAKRLVLKFGENEKIAKEVSWLIENHLLLSEFGFKKDIEDYSIIKKISKKVDTLERLKGIYLLTVCDISAVDHGIWNDWKATLLEKLYLKIKDEIKKPKKGSLNKKIEDIKNSVLFSSKIINKHKLEKFSKITYPNYWLLQNKGSIKYQIENFFLSENQLAKRFNFVIKKNKRFNFLEIIVVTNDRPSLFLDLITVILSENLSVHEARIFTLDDGMVIDTFIVSYNYNKNFLASEIKRKIDSLNKKFTDLSKGKTLPISYVFKNTKNKIIERNEINFDNKTSSTYTVLEVITNDKPGLLYDISKILLKNKIVISMAKISTNGDFVEDSFHIRNEFGMKVDNETFIKNLKSEILSSLTGVLKNVS